MLNALASQETLGTQPGLQGISRGPDCASYGPRPLKRLGRAALHERQAQRGSPFSCEASLVGFAAERSRASIHPGRPTLQLRCLLTSLVISNIETCFLPPKTTFSLSSALIIRLSLASWRLFLRM